jgi:hypothetical protein
MMANNVVMLVIEREQQPIRTNEQILIEVYHFKPGKPVMVIILLEGFDGGMVPGPEFSNQLITLIGDDTTSHEV